VLDVLDGKRAPRGEERVGAVLRHVCVGFHTHLMSRGPGTAPGPVEASERDADRLAFELLAPVDEVLARAADKPSACRVLRDVFGLPAAQANEYAGLLFPVAPSDPLVARLRSARPFLSNSGGPVGTGG
jgi:hypothetical protein